MGKIINALDRISELLFGKETPDELIEDNAKWSGEQIPLPSWYLFIVRRLYLIGLMIAVLIIGLIYLISRSTEFASLSGLAAVMYLLIPALGLLLAPLAAIAYIERKVNFSNTLPPEQKEVYVGSIKKRVKDFITLLLVAIMVTIVVVGVIILYYVRK